MLFLECFQIMMFLRCFFRNPFRCFLPPFFFFFFLKVRLKIKVGCGIMKILETGCRHTGQIWIIGDQDENSHLGEMAGWNKNMTMWY